MRYELAIHSAKQYLAADFTVIYQDIIISAALPEVVHMFTGLPLHVVVLCPQPDVVAAREEERAKRGYKGFSAVEFDREFRANTPRLGFWLDSSELTITATVDTILADLDQARIKEVSTR